MRGFFLSRLAPPSGQASGGRDLALEGMRGLCAVIVLYGHALAPIPCLDPIYYPPDPFLWFDSARIAVLFFFVLSGYVIGLTVKTAYAAPQVKGYLGRRLLRLVPVNTAAVLLSWALAPRTHPGTVLGNLAFLQNYNPYFFGWRVPIMANDPSLWTLNFELFYYLMFIAIWRFAPRLGPLLCVLAVAAVASAVVPAFPQFLSCYAIGALYWFGGLAVAWLSPRQKSHGNWPCALLVAGVMWPLNPLGKIVSAWHFTDYNVPSLSLQRLDLLPVCMWVLLAITGRAPRWNRGLTVACLIWASAGLVLRFATGDFADKTQGAFIAYSVAIAVAWALARWRPEPEALARLAPLGLVSFGLYAVSLALQFGLLTWPALPSGTAGTYCLRLALLLALSFGIAWLLERRLQPVLRRLMGARSAGGRPQRA